MKFKIINLAYNYKLMNINEIIQIYDKHERELLLWEEYKRWNNKSDIILYFVNEYERFWIKTLYNLYINNKDIILEDDIIDNIRSDLYMIVENSLKLYKNNKDMKIWTYIMNNILYFKRNIVNKYSNPNLNWKSVFERNILTFSDINKWLNNLNENNWNEKNNSNDLNIENLSNNIDFNSIYVNELIEKSKTVKDFDLVMNHFYFWYKLHELSDKNWLSWERIRQRIENSIKQIRLLYEIWIK